MLPYIAEFCGTALLILLGNGVVANVNLNKSGMKGAGVTQITLAWGFAVLIPAFIFGEASGAHFNPALSIALVFDNSLDTSLLFGYIIAQLLGAMFGSLLVYFMFKCQYDETDNGELIRGTFCTAPSIYNPFFNLISEIIGTFVLVFAIKGIGNVTDIATGVDKIFVFAIIVSIGMSLGGLTGYAINPCRDLGPRIIYSILPIKNKVDANWRYAIIPIVGPIIGAVLAVFAFNAIPF